MAPRVGRNQHAMAPTRGVPRFALQPHGLQRKRAGIVALLSMLSLAACMTREVVAADAREGEPPPVAWAGAGVFSLEPATPAGASGAGGASPATPSIDGAAAGSTTDDAGEAVPRLSPEECQAETFRIPELTTGRARIGNPLAITGAIATSQKFLVSVSKAGSCLWGVYAADEATRGPGTGLLLVSYGAPRSHEDAACDPTTDALPSDLSAGDLLSARGFLTSFAPASCPELTPALSLRLEPACPLQRAGHREPPAPAIIDHELATAIARGAEAETQRAWGGVLVQLEDISVALDPNDGDGVGAYGVVSLNETALELHSRIYYYDLSGAGPRDPAKAAHVTYPQRLAQVTGIVMLDYCTWSLAPRDRCRDAKLGGADCGEL